MEHLLQAAAVLSAAGVVVGAGVKAWQKVWSFVVKTHDTIQELKDTLADLKTHSHENHMSLLRLTIMSNEMPIGERIVAGHKYLKEGGNGEVKAFLKNKFNIEETVENAEHYKE